ncbi:MAG: 3-oxoacyl-[acyl-carrier-protein] reductase [Chloroflexota bacterium]
MEGDGVNLTGKTALVTGASRGIGRATALALAAQGAAIVVNYSASESAAAEVVAQITAAGGRATAIRADVSQAAEVEQLVARSIETYGRIDILVSNAGINRDNLLMRMSERDWDDVLATNLKAAFLCTKAVLRSMIRQRSGRLIYMSSVVGLSGNAGQSNYAAAKAGLVGLAKSTAREVGSRGITANVVAPGFIETDMTTRLSAQIRQKAVEQIPLERFGQPQDVAEAVAFLASDAAAYITGQVLKVDGGMVMP